MVDLEGQEPSSRTDNDRSNDGKDKGEAEEVKPLRTLHLRVKGNVLMCYCKPCQ